MFFIWSPVQNVDQYVKSFSPYVLYWSHIEGHALHVLNKHNAGFFFAQWEQNNTRMILDLLLFRNSWLKTTTCSVFIQTGWHYIEMFFRTRMCSVSGGCSSHISEGFEGFFFLVLWWSFTWSTINVSRQILHWVQYVGLLFFFSAWSTFWQWLPTKSIISLWPKCYFIANIFSSIIFLNLFYLLF